MKFPWRRRRTKPHAALTEEEKTQFRNELRAELVETTIHDLAKVNARNYHPYPR
ncbi:hypothetical protein [Streptomyces sp. NPDC051994]|uniref:hypothetical protein n=1 Tax=unclassified Streptomyces TaxID=2593676 RepID=UPI0034448706